MALLSPYVVIQLRHETTISPIALSLNVVIRSSRLLELQYLAQSTLNVTFLRALLVLFFLGSSLFHKLGGRHDGNAFKFIQHKQIIVARNYPVRAAGAGRA